MVLSSSRNDSSSRKEPASFVGSFAKDASSSRSRNAVTKSVERLTSVAAGLIRETSATRRASNRDPKLSGHRDASTVTSVAVISRNRANPFTSCHVAKRILNPIGLVASFSRDGFTSAAATAAAFFGAPPPRVSFPPRSVTSTPAASTGTFRVALPGKAPLGESDGAGSIPPRDGERGERGAFFASDSHEPARRGAGEDLAPPKSPESGALKAAWPLWSATKPPPDSPPAEGDLGETASPARFADVAAASDVWRKMAPRLAVSSARLDASDSGAVLPPPLFGSLRGSSPGATGISSRSRAPLSLFEANSYSHVSSVTIWPVYSTSSTRTDSIGPDAKVTSTSLTCRKPTEPTWMVTPRAFVTRTWKASFRVSKSWRRGVRREVVERGPPAGAAAASSRDRGSSLDSRRRRG